MKLNCQVCYIFGLDYRIFNQCKVVIEGDISSVVNNLIGRKCCVDS